LLNIIIENIRELLIDVLPEEVEISESKSGDVLPEDVEISESKSDDVLLEDVEISESKSDDVLPENVEISESKSDDVLPEDGKMEKKPCGFCNKKVSVEKCLKTKVKTSKGDFDTIYFCCFNCFESYTKWPNKSKLFKKTVKNGRYSTKERNTPEDKK